MAKQPFAKRWGVNLISSSYAGALAFLFIILLRAIAVQISPPPNYRETYPDVSTEIACQAEGGSWRITADKPTPRVPADSLAPQGYCQGPLTFEKERDAQDDASRAVTLIVFAIGGTLAAAAGIKLQHLKAVPLGLLLGGLLSFFVATMQVWQLSAGLGRLITITVLFIGLSAFGYHTFNREE